MGRLAQHRMDLQDTSGDTPDRGAHLPARSVVRKLRREIIASLKQQGFEVKNDLIVPPSTADKSALRALHASSVAHKIERARGGLERHEPRLIGELAASSDVRATEIDPWLVEVHRGTAEELLFRWAALHWSIPVSSGYGRRLRFLVRDASNGKLIGLIGLGDPVFALAARDHWIGWSNEERRRRLVHVADAFVLGAVPPYAELLGGKLIAMLATSDEVRAAWESKYAGRNSVMTRTRHDGSLALITTGSALGRSSIYNRLRWHGQTAYEALGYTRGSGEFHFSDGLHRAITEFALEHCVPSAKDPRWGHGFRNRREIVKKALPPLGFSDRLLYHGVKRQIFAAPLARNACEFLRGETSDLHPNERPALAISEHWRKRWLLPRSRRLGSPTPFDPYSWHLWCREDDDPANRT
jgi:hypothetical protein